MIKAIGLFLATYAATAAITYGIAQTPIPLMVSYARYVCHLQRGFYPLDGLAVCNLIAGLVSALVLRKLLTTPSQRTVTAGDFLYSWKHATLIGLALFTAYRAYTGVSTNCADLVLAYSNHPSTEGYSVIYSVPSAAMGHLLFDLRRYHFEIARPR
jgi:hypothetical protein